MLAVLKERVFFFTVFPHEKFLKLPTKGGRGNDVMVTFGLVSPITLSPEKIREGN